MNRVRGRLTLMSVTLTLALALALAACGGASSAPAAGSTSSDAASRPPSSASASPTATLLTADQAAAKLASVGVTLVHKVTQADDPNHKLGMAGGYSSKDNLAVPGAAASGDPEDSTAAGAAVECYPNVAGAQARMALLQSVAGTPVGDGMDTVFGGCVLRVSTGVPQDTANKIATAFSS